MSFKSILQEQKPDTLSQKFVRSEKTLKSLEFNELSGHKLYTAPISNIGHLVKYIDNIFYWFSSTHPNPFKRFSFFGRDVNVEYKGEDFILLAINYQEAYLGYKDKKGVLKIRLDRNFSEPFLIYGLYA